MENTYGIGVTNRFELFVDDESDPLEALKQREQEKQLKKKTKVAEKENKGKTEQPVKTKPAPIQKKIVKDPPVQKIPQDNRREEGKPNHQRSNNDGKPDRTSNKFSSENREERNNRRNREDRPFNGPSENNRDREDRPPRRDDNFENRNRGERRGPSNKTSGPRGPRNRNFDERRGKREFDRQSGSDKTGVKPVDKREGAGPHNWGSHRDVIEEADKTNTEIDASWGDVEKPEVPVVNEQNEKENEGEQPPVEEEPKELTLDEWKAQRGVRAKPQFNIRKAGEGEDPSQWKKMYELNKKKGEDEQESEEEEYDASEYPQRVGRQKHILDIDIHFNDTRRGLGGRGRGSRSGPRGNRNKEQRGGGGGGGGSGGGGSGGGTGAGGGSEKQGARYRAAEEPVEKVEERTDNRGAPKVDDERDFPSLG